MAKLEIRMGPGPGLMSKLGQKMGEEEDMGEEDDGMLEEACTAVYDALKSDDKEGFVEALMTALSYSGCEK